jgi:hypothetical protein
VTEDERLHQAGNATRFDDDDRSETVEEYDPAPAKTVAGAVGRSRRTTMHRFEQVENHGTPAIV